ncbi:MAG: DUF1398 family protein [Sporocytophaga sp.]|uniref:DUF1398 family protein n=1 Tax=Sporocytophaga sp. TaxID=2231183 RepID=UPI001B2F6224|nr:DUF1398 family protein [Sporocytophaga sp.]MBO9700432.1 DUF1398 family protein [Sporocytophaga sp.]
MADLHNKINELYKSSKSYPDLVKNLIGIGVQSYSVEVSSGIILYRFVGGENILHGAVSIPREISESFNRQLVLNALKDTQEGRTTYPEFMDDIAFAGVRFYEATLNGNNKRVTYIGIGGSYEEAIPL